MTVTIAPASQEDIREVLRVMFKAYEGKDAYINACFPRGLTDEGLEINYQRLLFLTKIVPEIYWEKATDDESGKIIGGTMWALHKDAKPTKAPLDGPEGTWENQTEKEYGQALFSSGGEDDESYWAQNGLPILRLIVLAVDPNYQRQKIGTKLTKSGMTVANREQASITVIASFPGKELYQKLGFRLLRERDLEVPDKFSDRPKYHIWYLAREKGSG